MLQPSIVGYVAPQARAQGIQQGIQQGTQETIRKLILEVLALRLAINAEQTFQLSLETIDDLEQLNQLFASAMKVENPEEFEQVLNKVIA